MKRVSFIIHGKLKRNVRLKQKLDQYFSSRFEVSYYFTEACGDAIHLGKNAIEKSTDYLIAVGGDGMLNEAVNGYMNAGVELRTNTALGILPFGTGNDFARSNGIRQDPEQLAILIEKDQTLSVDIGEVQYISERGASETRYFLNITDIGIGGYVVKIVNKGSRILGSFLTYHKAIIQSFLTYKHQNIILKSDDFQWEGPILSLCMANAPSFAGGMFIAPQADFTDGFIQLVIFARVKLLDYIKNLSRIKKGEILDHPEIHYKKTRSCSIRSLNGECPIDMDGEFIGYTPLEVKIHQQVVKFVSAK